MGMCWCQKGESLHWDSSAPGIPAAAMLESGTLYLAGLYSTFKNFEEVVFAAERLVEVYVSVGNNHTLNTSGTEQKRYNKVSEQTVVWVANRDRPINNSFGILTINKDGNLLLSAQNIPIWSTNISQPVSSNGSQAHILDSGNLILLLGDKRNVLWQSFDYPTHTFLPGMKLGLNKKSHQNWTITSWRSTNDPGHGDYSFQVDPNGSPQFFLYMGSNPIWRTGPWVGQRRSGVRDMTRAYIFNYSLVSNKDEVSLTYTVLNPSVISVFMVDGVTGTVLRKTWHEDSHRWIKFWSAPKEQCDDYGECGAYGSCNSNSGNQFMCSCFPGYRPRSPRDWYFRDGSGGCVRIENRSMCGNGEGFSRLSSVKLPDTSKAEVNMSMTMEECRENCLRNCSCMGYTTADETTNNGCIAFYERLIDTRLYASEGKDLFFRLDAVELAKYNKMKRGHARKTLKAILIVVMVLALTALLSFSYWLYFKKKKRELDEQSERALWTKDSDESDSTSADLPFLHRRVIASATNNFNPDNKLGEGGFGSVYKGQLHNGQEIAVKRLAKNSGQGIEEFKNEVRSIAKLQHRNLVRMLGCCVEGDEKMLIYEYLPNKSLDKFIFDEEKRSSLDWKKRFEIIMGIARGILYLHQDSRFRIIHRDLKASNVLLDADLLPKISDFGIARIFSSDQIEANTNRVVGTYGYMSPEYAMEGLFSIKSDVFSFGVLLLEIISGRKNSGYYQDNPSVNLIGHVWELWKEGKALDITDPTLAAFGHDIDNEEEMLRCIQIGLLCVQEQAHDRLTMAAVIFMLSNRADQLPPPKQPAFVFKASHHHRAHDNPSSSSTGAHSVNELTVTMVEGR